MESHFLGEIRIGLTPMGAPNTGGVSFRPICRYLFQTVQDTDIVTVRG